MAPLPARFATIVPLPATTTPLGLDTAWMQAPQGFLCRPAGRRSGALYSGAAATSAAYRSRLLRIQQRNVMAGVHTTAHRQRNSAARNAADSTLTTSAPAAKTTSTAHGGACRDRNNRRLKTLPYQKQALWLLMLIHIHLPYKRFTLFHASEWHAICEAGRESITFPLPPFGEIANE